MKRARSQLFGSDETEEKDVREIMYEMSCSWLEAPPAPLEIPVREPSAEISATNRIPSFIDNDISFNRKSFESYSIMGTDSKYRSRFRTDHSALFRFPLSGAALERFPKTQLMDDLMVETDEHRVSRILYEDHMRYLFLTNKWKDGMRKGLPDELALGKKERAELNGFAEHVQTEQRQYISACKRKVQKDEKEAYTQMPEIIKKHIDNGMEIDLLNMQSIYPSSYEECAKIALKSLTPHQPCIPIHIKTSHSTGHKVSIKRLEPKEYNLSFDFALPNRSPPTRMSVDPVVMDVLKKEGVHFAFSMTALQKLFSLKEKDHAEVRIPFVILSGMIKQGPMNRQLIFDDPLYNSNYSTRSYCTKYFDQAFHEYVLKQGDQTSSEVKEYQYVYEIYTISGFKMLIRSKKFGVEKEKGKGSSSGIAFHAKVHCQSGQEVYTTDEISQWWLRSWLLGEKIIQVGHFDKQRMTLRNVEEYSLSTLLLATYDFINTTERFSRLGNLLRRLYDFPENKYILSLGEKSSDITLLRNIKGLSSSPQGSTFELWDFLENTKKLSEDMNFLPLVWTNPNRIPYTFPYPTYCLSFLRHGFCPLIANAEACAGFHIQFHQHLKDVFVHSPTRSMVEFKQTNTTVAIGKSFCWPFVVSGECSDPKVCKHEHLDLRDLMLLLVNKLRKTKKTHKKKNRASPKWRHDLSY